MAGTVQKNAQAAPKYTRAELMNHAEALFAVKAEVLHGALFEAAQQTFSIQEVRESINQFMKAKVNG